VLPRTILSAHGIVREFLPIREPEPTGRFNGRFFANVNVLEPQFKSFQGTASSVSGSENPGIVLPK
jgi:hypothetical protein